MPAGASFGRRSSDRRAGPAPIAAFESSEEAVAAIRQQPPRRSGGSWAFGIAAAVVFAGVFGFVASNATIFPGAPALAPAEPAPAAAPLLIPQSEMPDIDTDNLSRSADFVTRYPRDPRAHLMRGIYFLEHKNLAAAEQQMRAALAEPEILKNDLPAHYEQGIRITLAIILVAERRKPEAVIVAGPVCGGDMSNVIRGLRNMFLRTGVCKKAA